MKFRGSCVFFLVFYSFPIWIISIQNCFAQELTSMKEIKNLESAYDESMANWKTRLNEIMWTGQTSYLTDIHIRKAKKEDNLLENGQADIYYRDQS